MKTFTASLLAAVSSAELLTNFDYKFMKFISEHNKIYKTLEEFNLRKALFGESDEHIAAVNSNPESTYTAGHNKFSDWTQEEFDGLLGLKDMEMPAFDETKVDEADVANLPTEWDWRAENKVTAVKDQGSCGSCWAFSSIEAVESAWMIAGNSEVIMSEQDLVDCSSSFGNNGCSGGWYFWSYDYLKNASTMKESDYPYTARDGTCKHDESKGVTKVSSYGQVNGTDANLAQLSKQPVNVAVAAGNRSGLWLS